MSFFEKSRLAGMPAASEIDWPSAYTDLLPRVYHYFCLKVGDELEAEDLTAATFERAWRDRTRYRRDLGTLTHWIFGIARHVAVAHFREKERRHPGMQANVHDVDRPTEEAATRQQEFERLASLLPAFSEREREIFSLKYGGQFTNRAISGMTGLTESNVGTILHRLVTRLREQLEET